MARIVGSGVFQVGPSLVGFQQELRSKLSRISATKDVRLTVDSRLADAQIRAFTNRPRQDVKIGVRTDENSFRNAEQRFRRLEVVYKKSAVSRAIRINVAVTGASLLPLLAQGALSAAAALTELGQAALILPGILGGALATVGTLATGLSGLGAAFSAAGKGSKDAAKFADDYAKSTRAMERAQRDVAKSLKDANREIEDQGAKLRHTFLDQEQAAINVAKAKEALAKGGGNYTDYRQRVLDLNEALFDQAEAQKEAGRTVADAYDAMQKGATGSDTFRDAVDSLSTAVDAFTKAQKQASGFTEEFTAAMANLSPAAQDFVTKVLSLRDAWKGLQNAVSSDLLTGLGDSIVDVANKRLPQLQASMQGVAQSLNGLFKDVIGNVGNNANFGRIQEVFKNTAEFIKRATPGLNAFVDGFLKLAEVGSRFLPRLGDAFTSIANRFENFINLAAADGSLENWINRGLNVIGKLFDAIGSIGSILNSVTTAYEKATGNIGGFATTLSDSLGKLATYLSSPAGQTSLVNYLKKAQEFIGSIREAVPGILSAFEQFSEAARTFASIFFPIFGKIGSILKDNATLTQGLILAYIAWRGVLKPLSNGLQNVYQLARKEASLYREQLAKTQRAQDALLGRKYANNPIGSQTAPGAGGLRSQLVQDKFGSTVAQGNFARAAAESTASLNALSTAQSRYDKIVASGVKDTNPKAVKALDALKIAQDDANKASQRATDAWNANRAAQSQVINTTNQLRDASAAAAGPKGLGKLRSAIGGAANGLIGGLTGILSTLGTAAAVGGVIYAITQWQAVNSEAADQVDRHTKSVQDLSEALDGAGGAATQATRAKATDLLQNSQLTGTGDGSGPKYGNTLDAAQKAGIDPFKLTTALATGDTKTVDQLLKPVEDNVRGNLAKNIDPSISVGPLGNLLGAPGLAAGKLASIDTSTNDLLAALSGDPAAVEKYKQAGAIGSPEVTNFLDRIGVVDATDLNDIRQKLPPDIRAQVQFLEAARSAQRDLPAARSLVQQQNYAKNGPASFKPGAPNPFGPNADVSASGGGAATVSVPNEMLGTQANPSQLAQNIEANGGQIKWGDRLDGKTDVFLEAPRAEQYVQFKAAGGHISGPGGPRDDKIPAMLSNGEFVINAKSASILGAQNLHALNNADKYPQHFAIGGAAGQTPFKKPAFIGPVAPITNLVGALGSTPPVAPGLASAKGGTEPRGFFKNSGPTIAPLVSPYLSPSTISRTHGEGLDKPRSAAAYADQYLGPLNPFIPPPAPPAPPPAPAPAPPPAPPPAPTAPTPTAVAAGNTQTQHTGSGTPFAPGPGPTTGPLATDVPIPTIDQLDSYTPGAISANVPPPAALDLSGTGALPDYGRTGASAAPNAPIIPDANILGYLTSTAETNGLAVGSGHRDEANSQHSVDRALDIGNSEQAQQGKISEFVKQWISDPTKVASTRQLIFRGPDGDYGIINGRVLQGQELQSVFGGDLGGHTDHVHLALEGVPNELGPDGLPLGISTSNTGIPGFDIPAFNPQGGGPLGLSLGADGSIAGPYGALPFKPEEFAKSLGKIALQFLGGFLGIDLSQITDPINTALGDPSISEGGSQYQDNGYINDYVSGKLPGNAYGAAEKSKIIGQLVDQAKQKKAAGDTAGAQQLLDVAAQVKSAGGSTGGFGQGGAYDGSPAPAAAYNGGSAEVHGAVYKAFKEAGGDDKEWPQLVELINGESSWDPGVQYSGPVNSDAFGLFQFLSTTWAGTGIQKTTDPYQQAVAGMRYIKNRYGSVTAANTFKKANNYYADGGAVGRGTGALPFKRVAPISPFAGAAARGSFGTGIQNGRGVGQVPGNGPRPVAGSVSRALGDFGNVMNFLDTAGGLFPKMGPSVFSVGNSSVGNSVRNTFASGPPQALAIDGWKSGLARSAPDLGEAYLGAPARAGGFDQTIRQQWGGIGTFDKVKQFMREGYNNAWLNGAPSLSSDGIQDLSRRAAGLHTEVGPLGIGGTHVGTLQDLGAEMARRAAWNDPTEGAWWRGLLMSPEELATISKQGGLDMDLSSFAPGRVSAPSETAKLFAGQEVESAGVKRLVAWHQARQEAARAAGKTEPTMFRLGEGALGSPIDPFEQAFAGQFGVTGIRKPSVAHPYNIIDLIQHSMVPRHAAGGHISGPGGPTDDKIPAMLSDGEYVIRAKAAKKLGRSNLDMLNRAHFAIGGMAGTPFKPPLPIPGARSTQTPGPLPLAPTGAGPSAAIAPPAPLAPAPPPPAPGTPAAGASVAPGPAPLPSPDPTVPGATAQGASAPDPNALAGNVADAAAALYGGAGGTQPGATQGPGDNGEKDPRAIIGAQPADSNHLNPGLKSGIEGAFQQAGALGAQAASAAASAGTLGAGGAAGGAAGSFIQGGAQIAGQVASGAANILASLAVGTLTGGTTGQGYGAPLLPQQAPQTPVRQFAPVQNNTVNVQNNNDWLAAQKRMDAQQSAGFMNRVPS